MFVGGFFFSPLPPVEFFLLIAFTHLTERAVKRRYAEQQIVLFIEIQRSKSSVWQRLMPERAPCHESPVKLRAISLGA